MREGGHIILKENVKKFSDFVNEFITAGLDGDRRFELSDFLVAESYLNVFGGFPELSGIEAIENMRDALMHARQPGPLFNSTKYMKEAAEMICSNTMPLILEAKNLAREIKPTKNLEKRDAMIQLIGKYQRLRSELNETAEKYGYSTGDSMNLWIKYYKKHGTDLIGVLNDLRNRDKDLEFEQDFQDAIYRLTREEYSYFEEDESIRAYKKIENLMSSCDSIESLVGVIKAEYNIKEDEVPSTDGIKLEEDLSAAYNRITKLTEIIESFPRHGGSMENLEALNKELSSKIGLNRPADDLYQTLYRIIGAAEKIILTGVAGSFESLIPTDRRFLTNSYRIGEFIEGLPGDQLLDEPHKELIKNYSIDVGRFILRKGSI